SMEDTMRTLSELATKSGSRGRPVSAKSVFRTLGAKSLRDAIATFTIQDFHRRTGGSAGPLGFPNGALVRNADGSYLQNYLLGDTRLQDFAGDPDSRTFFGVTATVAGVRCFGTDDPSGSDEIYAVISLVNVNANFKGTDELATTIRTEINNDTEKGQ